MIKISWEDVLKKNRNFAVGDIVVSNSYDTRYSVNDPRRIQGGARYRVVDIEGDKIRVEMLNHPDDPTTPVEELQDKNRFDYYSDSSFKDTSERDAERAFGSRLYGSSRSRGNTGD